MLLTLAKVGVACLGLIAVCAASSRWLLVNWATMELLRKLGALLLTIGVAVAVFAAAGVALKIPEMQDMSAALARRFKRAQP
jgi:hypothetical protein